MPSKISPCLWFDSQAEEAAQFYTGIFKDGKITGISHYGEAGFDHHGRPAGSVLTVEFEINGQSFTALNGGPVFKLSEAISIQVFCDTQEELDYYWERLKEGGDPNSQQCGWLKDKYGLSWQIVPSILPKLMTDPDPVKTNRTMAALMEMEKLDIAALQRAFEG